MWNSFQKRKAPLQFSLLVLSVFLICLFIYFKLVLETLKKIFNSQTGLWEGRRSYPWLTLNADCAAENTVSLQLLLTFKLFLFLLVTLQTVRMWGSWNKQSNRYFFFLLLFPYFSEAFLPFSEKEKKLTADYTHFSPSS